MTLHVRRLALAIVLAGLALQGCAGPDPADADARAKPVRDEPRSQLLAADALEGGGCPLLHSVDVADAAGVEPAAVVANPAMACLYSWPGGRAVLSNIQVHDTIQRAVEHFALGARVVTPDEAQAGVEALDARLGAKAAAGGITREQEAVGGALARGIAGVDAKDVAVEGVGERARQDGTRMKVLSGNVIFDLAVTRGNAFDPRLTHALAERVVRNLPSP